MNTRTPRSPQAVPERAVLGRVPGRGRPAAGVADEDLHRLAAQLLRVHEGARGEPLADRHVGADGLRRPVKAEGVGMRTSLRSGADAHPGRGWTPRQAEFTCDIWWMSRRAEPT